MNNLQAFLTMIAVSEGTDGIGDRGYNVLVGSTKQQPILFGSYHDHPRLLVHLPTLKINSSAAGRYQILARYYDAYRRFMHLVDFSPTTQDQIAMQMIREQLAMADVMAGRFDAAVTKVSNIWASFPGSGHGQRENKLADLRDAYTAAGGVIVA